MVSDDINIVVNVITKDALNEIETLEEKRDHAMDRLLQLRDNARRIISQTYTLVNQTYSIIKRVVSAAGKTIDPLFDAYYQLISAAVSTALSVAAMWVSSMHPVLVGIGIGLATLSLALQAQSIMELDVMKQHIQSIMNDIEGRLRVTQPLSPIGPIGGSF